MRLYPKRLRNIRDLERERKILVKTSRKLEEEGFFPFGGKTVKKGGKGKAASGGLLDALPVSNPWVSLIISWVQARIEKRAAKAAIAKKAATDNVAVIVTPRSAKSVAKSAAVEFIGGYMKWKAIELSYKGIKYLVDKQFGKHL